MEEHIFTKDLVGSDFELQFSRVHLCHDNSSHTSRTAEKKMKKQIYRLLRADFTLLNVERKVNRRGTFECWMFFVAMAALNIHTGIKKQESKIEMCDSATHSFSCNEFTPGIS